METALHSAAHSGFMKSISKASIRLPLLVALLVFVSIAANAQAPARFVGSVSAITGNSLTVKTDAGEQRQFDVSSEAVIKRIEPGEKDLSKAATIAFSDLAVGDRVLVKLDAASPTPQAAQIIAVKAEDLAQKQQKDREDWQRRGVAGLVKSVDPASGAITLTTGAGATAKTVTVHTTKASVLKRYAPGSVRYDQAQAGAHRCDSTRRPVACARGKDRRWIGDRGRRSRIGKFSQYRRNHCVAGRGHLDPRREGSRHQETGHNSHPPLKRRCGASPSAWHRCWQRA